MNFDGTEIEYEGKQKYLKTHLPDLLELAARSHNGEIKKSLREINESLQINQANLESLMTSIAESSEEMGNRLEGYQEALQEALGEIISLADNPDELITLARRLQEMNMSFSLQYLQLQQKIQQDTREFNLLSNIMKTKHEAAKNSINNIR
jgi:hypothetical protein